MSSPSSAWCHGRLPWYDAGTSAPAPPFIIVVAGGTASGKSTVCRLVLQQLGLSWVHTISTDNFYKPLTAHQRHNVHNVNFDHPHAFDWDLLANKLQRILSGDVVDIPLYDFVTHSRKKESRAVFGADVIIVEGILAFHDARIRDMADLKIFVDTDADLRLARRLRRDISERGRSLESVLQQYEKTVKPSFDDFVAPLKKYADIIIPRGGDNTVAIGLIVQHIRALLMERGVQFAAARNAQMMAFDADSSKLDAVHILHLSAVRTARHTALHSRETSRDDFCFHVQCLSRQVALAALDLLEYDERIVTTPTGARFAGVALRTRISVCSVVRAGEAMEPGVAEVLPNAPIGKVLIQHSGADAPRFYFSKLAPLMPDDDDGDGGGGSVVFVLDPIVRSGTKAQMAVRVLLDAGVRESDIVMLCLMAAPAGLLRLCRLHSQLRVVVSRLDPAISVIGGDFDDRFFGTDAHE